MHEQKHGLHCCPMTLTLLVMHVTYRFPWSSKQSPDGRAMSSDSPQKGRSDTSCPAHMALYSLSSHDGMQGQRTLQKEASSLFRQEELQHVKAGLCSQYMQSE